MTIAEQINETLSALDTELRDAENRVRRLQRAIDALREVQPVVIVGTVRPPAPPAQARTMPDGEVPRSLDVRGSQASILR